MAPIFGINLSVSLGSDTTFCSHNLAVNSRDTAFIGSQLQILGGVPPYIYQWSCKVHISNAIYQAKAFLNSDTVVNPYFKAYFLNQNWEKLTLTVTDSNEHTASDSIMVRFSSWGMSFEPCSIFTYQNDSCRLSALCGISGGIPPYKYSWSPSEDLSDSTVEEPWCYATQNRTYGVTIVDSCGCSLSSSIIVEIVTTNMLQAYQDNKGVYMRKGRIYMDSSYINCQVLLFTIDGRLLYSGISDSELDVSFCTRSQCNYIMLLNSQSGCYHFKLSNN